MSMAVERTTTRSINTAASGTLRLTTKSYGHHVLAVNNGSRDQREASSGETYLDDDALRALLVVITEAVKDLD